MPKPPVPGRVPDQMVMVPGDRPYLLIVPRDDGFVNVKGPLNNPTMCYGWLLSAFEYILHRNVAQIGVHPEGGHVGDPGMSLPPDPNRMGGDGRG